MQAVRGMAGKSAGSVSRYNVEVVPNGRIAEACCELNRKYINQISFLLNALNCIYRNFKISNFVDMLNLISISMKLSSVVIATFGATSLAAVLPPCPTATIKYIFAL